MPAARDIVRAVLVPVALSLGLVAALVAITGYPPGPALAALWRGAFGSPYAIVSATLVRATPRLLRHLVPGSRLHAGLILAVAAALVAGWVMRATAPGFRLRAAGANPWAAASAGLIDVPATTTSAFLASGALAGLAGAVEV